MTEYFLECITKQNKKEVEKLIDNKEISLSKINLSELLYYLRPLFWEVDFFEFLLKNNIQINKKKYFDNIFKTPTEKMIYEIDNNIMAEECNPEKYEKYSKKLNEMLLLLVEYGANPNIIFSEAFGVENISFLECAYMVDKKVYKLLIEKGANIDIIYSYNEDELPSTPLSLSIEDEDIEIMQILIKHDVKIDFWSTYAIFIKFEYNYLWKEVDKIKNKNQYVIQKSNIALIEKVKNFENKQNKVNSLRKNTQLIKILKILIDYGMYVNYTFNKKSIFNYALENEDVQTIQVFLDNHIENHEPIEMLNNDLSKAKETLFNFASNVIEHINISRESQDKKISKFYRKKYELDKDSELVSSLKSRNFTIFNGALTKDIGILIPLTDLIKEDYSVEFIKKTIESGANINFQDNNGMTPLMHACKKNKKDIVNILLKNSCNLETEDNTFRKVLYYTRGDYELIKIILAKYDSSGGEKLVKILKNFTKDTPIKYTTHSWDFGTLEDEYKNFNGFLDKARGQFDGFSDELKNLSPNLYKKIYAFLFEINPEDNYSWCSKEKINIGWSSLKGLKEWCDSGNKPQNFDVSSLDLIIENEDISTFDEIINLFKQEIEIRSDFKNLSKIFLDKQKDLGKKFTLKPKKLDKQFYADTQKLNYAISKIFEEIKKRDDFSEVNVFTKELEDDSIELHIVHKGSYATKDAKGMLNEAEDGDFADIKESLSNMCDWSIENSFDSKNYRINYLKSKSINDEEELLEKVDGFTHILRFYTA